MKNKWVIGIVAYAALILLCALVIYVVPSVRTALVRTYIVEQGEVSLSDEVEAYVVRSERVYVAGKAAEVSRIAKAGKLVKAGTNIIKLKDIVAEDTNKTKTAGKESSDVQADKKNSGKADEENVSAVKPSSEYDKVKELLKGRTRSTESGSTVGAGYVCYRLDGLEGKLRPDRVKVIKQTRLKELTKNSLVKAAKGKVAEGDPVFKIVKNAKYYLIFYLDNETAGKYEEGDSLSFEVNGESVPATVWFIKKGQTESKIVLKSGTFFKNYTTARVIRPVVTVASASGLKLSDKSLCKKNKQTGVLVRNKLGNYVFKPVCIKADDGENCVVYQDIYMDEGGNFVETISIYDEIVSNPSDNLVKESE